MIPAVAAIVMPRKVFEIRSKKNKPKKNVSNVGIKVEKEIKNDFSLFLVSSYKGAAVIMPSGMS